MDAAARREIVIAGVQLPDDVIHPISQATFEHVNCFIDFCMMLGEAAL